jgi:hypothetical protein
MTETLTLPNGTASFAAANPPPAARDFSRKRKRLDFTIDDDTFEAASAIPAEIYAEFVSNYSNVDENGTTADVFKAMASALETVLLPDSFARFKARLRDRTNPIELAQMTDVVLWLIEEYGDRPTPPSQPSSDGPASPESGTNSTANTQPEASTSAPSQPADS